NDVILRDPEPEAFLECQHEIQQRHGIKGETPLEKERLGIQGLFRRQLLGGPNAFDDAFDPKSTLGVACILHQTVRIGWIRGHFSFR
ncbi:MAG: hypothetical protein JRG76_18565, partial [Deltaproteobacteria bacterium]|nr:hypothetical protein [Deltaproteobacteria bacterium]